jgi:hypothetical protein
MQTGTVWVNRYYNFQPGQGVGGYMQSGFGREGTVDTLNHYTVTKNVVINLGENARNRAESVRGQSLSILTPAGARSYQFAP